MIKRQSLAVTPLLVNGIMGALVTDGRLLREPLGVCTPVRHGVLLLQQVPIVELGLFTPARVDIGLTGCHLVKLH